MSDRPSQWICLNSGTLSVAIDPLGAQLSVLRDRDGRDLLWDGNPAVWSGRAPLLFPIVGALAGGRYRVDAKSYALSRHGFARGKVFDVVDASATSARFRLRADAATRQAYPFDFELTQQFDLQESTLSLSASVHNLGETALPASIGYHPAFRWPLHYGYPRSQHVIEFANDEPGPMRRLNADGLLTPTPHPTPILQRRLALADSLFQEDVVIFDDLRSRSVTYGAGSGPEIVVRYPDASYLGVWSKPGARFVCIEPWRGIADPVGFSGDFRAKPGVFMVAPGASVPINMSISLRGF